MGAWSHQPFGNDTACDWAYELEGQSDFSLVEKALRQVIDNGDAYLEFDMATEAVAAAEVLAKTKGLGTQSDAYTEEVDAWIQGLGVKPDPEMFDLAQRALKRILAPQSELRELWEESEEFVRWEASIISLQEAMTH